MEDWLLAGAGPTFDEADAAIIGTGEEGAVASRVNVDGDKEEDGGGKSADSFPKGGVFFMSARPKLPAKDEDEEDNGEDEEGEKVDDEEVEDEEEEKEEEEENKGEKGGLADESPELNNGEEEVDEGNDAAVETSGEGGAEEAEDKENEKDEEEAPTKDDKAALDDGTATLSL